MHRWSNVRSTPAKAGSVKESYREVFISRSWFVLKFPQNLNIKKIKNSASKSALCALSKQLLIVNSIFIFSPEKDITLFLFCLLAMRFYRAILLIKLLHAVETTSPFVCNIYNDCFRINSPWFIFGERMPWKIYFFNVEFYEYRESYLFERLFGIISTNLRRINIILMSTNY